MQLIHDLLAALFTGSFFVLASLIYCYVIEGDEKP